MFPAAPVTATLTGGFIFNFENEDEEGEFEEGEDEEYED